MKLWLLERDFGGYDTYSSAVVAAESEEEARLMHPDGRENWNGKEDRFWNTWADPESISVYFIGTAKPGLTKKGIVLAQFDAG